MDKLPILEEECIRCERRGWLHDGGEFVRCGVCDGSGYVPTEFGERVLSLMMHNFKPMLEDATPPKKSCF
jgi:hypothetical protein